VTPTPARPELHWTFFGVWAALGFALSAVVHALSYLSVAAQSSWPWVWALHVGIFPPFIAMVMRLRRWRDRTGPWRARSRLGELSPYFPRWVPVLAIALVIYVVFNFANATSHLPQRHQAPPTDAASAHENEVYTIRAFSGHWLLFYAAPALFFLFVPSSAAPRD
jgi:MFS family permease